MTYNSLTNLNGLNFQAPKYKQLIANTMLEDIRKVEYYAQSQYRDLDIVETLKFYTNRYVKQLFDFASINSNTVILDVGAGFGWLSMAFAYSTEAKIIAIDLNETRLNAGKKIANILGIEDKIDWRIGALGDLPIKDQEADIVYCIEVIEHVYKSKAAIYDLSRVTKDLVIVTTPNLWFPIIAHDTQLPFCHWLPISWRKRYAKLFDRHKREIDNLFWSPYSLQKELKEFKPISQWLHYTSYQKFKDTFPFYLPYGTGKYLNKLSLSKKLYYDIISKLGIYSHWFLPSLAYVFKRK
ncbi:bifunctional 2-polyprenyl-6-hydroxyphenol methylase/3-demethylubiquinol 3-O-methyltransferase UbiG [Pleurocapsa sp. PCC 7319]|uniref:class I SAM-dependent methyltransferase n=1 Tax=Pleurocapsa sp. PCC 7319 TaxID=118161 RepID=UPI00034A2EC4|nr:class I SAM-dependent methyltransferase [Pleurocapsa sp. PCC 7319]